MNDNSLDSKTLQKAITDIDRIDEAGRLDELWSDVHHYTNADPRANSTDPDPRRRFFVEDHARRLHQLLNVPLVDCEKAVQSCCPTRRQEIVLWVISTFIAELDGTAPPQPIKEKPSREPVKIVSGNSTHPAVKQPRRAR